VQKARNHKSNSLKSSQFLANETFTKSATVVVYCGHQRTPWRSNLSHTQHFYSRLGGHGFADREATSHALELSRTQRRTSHSSELFFEIQGFRSLDRGYSQMYLTVSLNEEWRAPMLLCAVLAVAMQGFLRALLSRTIVPQKGTIFSILILHSRIPARMSQRE
jgi:hypothetical protein